MKKAQLILLALSVVLFLLTLLFMVEVFTSPAIARSRCRTVWVIKRRHGHIVRRHHRIVRVRRIECPPRNRVPPVIRITHPINVPARVAQSFAPATASLPQASLPLPSILEVGNVPGCAFGPTDPKPYLDTYHATVLRIVVKKSRDESPAPCIQTAVSEGFRVHVVLQWDNHDTPAQVAAFVASELDAYGSYLWAVGLGNEQELGQGGIGGTPQQYSADWKAAEPVAVSLAPNAILVAGDVSPYGLPWLERAWQDGLPGARAVGAHPYQIDANSFGVSQVLAWARSTGLPAWFDEGLDGPHAWYPRPGADVSLAGMAGAQVAGAWWDGMILP